MKPGDPVTVVLDSDLKRELYQNGTTPFHDAVDYPGVVVNVHADDAHVDVMLGGSVRATGLAPFGADHPERSYYVGSQRPEPRLS